MELTLDESRTVDWGSVIIAQRARLHLWYRLASRSAQLAARSRGAITRRRIALIAAAAVVDVVTATWLVVDKRFFLGRRLVLDAADTAVAGTGLHELSPAVLTGVPLSIEAGLRLGFRGMLVPVASAGITALVRRVVGHETALGLSAFRWQVMGVGVGAGMGRYEQNHRRAFEAGHEREVQAQLQLHYLAGQNAVAMGADSVVDVLCRTMPLLASSAGDAAVTHMLGSWKRDLAATTADYATFLGVALTRWQTAHNMRQADLSADVVIRLPEGDGTVLLTAEQAHRLTDTLDEMDLRGRVDVVVGDRAEALLAGRPRRLIVDKTVITLPADNRSDPVPFDVGPAAFLVEALWALNSMAQNDAGSSPWAVCPVAVLALVCAGWSDRHTHRKGAAAHRDVLLVAVAVAALAAVATTTTARNPHSPDGVQRYPFMGGVYLLAVLYAFYRQSLRPMERLGFAGAMASVMGLGIAAMKNPLSVRDMLFSELVWPSAALATLARIGPSLEDWGAEFVDRVEDADQVRFAEAHKAGRLSVLALVSVVRDEARLALELHVDTLDDDIAGLVRTRLSEVDERLKELQCAES